MRFIQALLSFVGRALLVAIFLASALNHVQKFNGITEAVAAQGVPEPKIAHIVAVAFMFIGGVSVLLGFWARLGALLLALFLGAATFYFHAFWKLPTDSPEFEQQMIHAMKNIALLGAMVMIIANGPGAGAVDKRKVTLEV
jgi:putative oxidoreductase